MEHNMLILVLLVTVIGVVLCKPIEDSENYKVVETSPFYHKILKRYINPSLSLGGFSDGGFGKMRTKRSVDEDCEKLQLCKLHSESGHSFFAAYELYFVNKENAKLWDHRGHSIAECERRYSGCYGGSSQAKHAPPAKARNYIPYDYYEY